MIINRTILEAHGVCNAGGNSFIEHLGDQEIEYKKAIKWVIELEREDPENRRGWVTFMKNLSKSDKFHQMQPKN